MPFGFYIIEKPNSSPYTAAISHSHRPAMNDTTCPDAALIEPEKEPASSQLDGAANWFGISSLALGVFGLVTAEFLPASLLTAMATDLGISVGAAGQAVTATAIVGAVAAPTIPV